MRFVQKIFSSVNQEAFLERCRRFQEVVDGAVGLSYHLGAPPVAVHFDASYDPNSQTYPGGPWYVQANHFVENRDLAEELAVEALEQLQE